MRSVTAATRLPLRALLLSLAALVAACGSGSAPLETATPGVTPSPTPPAADETPCLAI